MTATDIIFMKATDIIFDACREIQEMMGNLENENVKLAEQLEAEALHNKQLKEELDELRETSYAPPSQGNVRYDALIESLLDAAWPNIKKEAAKFTSKMNEK